MHVHLKIPPERQRDSNTHAKGKGNIHLFTHGFLNKCLIHRGGLLAAASLAGHAPQRDRTPHISVHACLPTYIESKKREDTRNPNCASIIHYVEERTNKRKRRRGPSYTIPKKHGTIGWSLDEISTKRWREDPYRLSSLKKERRGENTPCTTHNSQTNIDLSPFEKHTNIKDRAVQDPTHTTLASFL